MAATECQGCGTKWSDGRTYCDHDHCGRADLPGQLRALRRKHYQPKRAVKPAPEQPKTSITVHRIT